MSQLRHHEARFAEWNLKVALITFEGLAAAEAYARESGLPWPVLIDQERRLYRAYGMERGSWRHLLGPATLRKYFRLLYRGEKLRRSGGDVKQLGGDVLIDPEGVVRYHHVGQGPADRPSIERLIDCVRRRR